MEVYIDKQNRNISIRFNGTVENLLKKLEQNKETVVVVRNGTLVTEKDKVKDTDSIKILSVVSGG